MKTKAYTNWKRRKHVFQHAMMMEEECWWTDKTKRNTLSFTIETELHHLKEAMLKVVPSRATK